MRPLFLFAFATLFRSGEPRLSPVPEAKLFELLNERFRVEESTSRGDSGERLFLTPLLDRGDVEGARSASEVDADVMRGVRSHAGYITVDREYNSNLWFWYFPPRDVAAAEAPLLVWLQGGPGASSLFGLFEELGPFRTDDNGTDLIINPHSWHLKHNLVFVDNPVGAGFSFTDHERGYATDQTRIGEQLYVFMLQFVESFPDLRKVPLFITGESYAGKHVPSFAYEIHRRNPEADVALNLKGLAIGNGFIDPATMADYSSFGYHLGLVDDAQRAVIERSERDWEAAVDRGNFTEAFRHFSRSVGQLWWFSKIDSVYNFAHEKRARLYGGFTNFVQSPHVRKALHVGNADFAPITDVYDRLIPDFMTSARPWLEELLEHYRVMLYSGQMDVIVAYPLSVRTYRSMEWSGSGDYLAAERKPWFVGDTLVGYVKRAGNLLEVMVRNAGHMVPADQPERALLLIESFVDDAPLNDGPSTHENEQ